MMDVRFPAYFTPMRLYCFLLFFPYFKQVQSPISITNHANPDPRSVSVSEEWASWTEPPIEQINTNENITFPRTTYVVGN